MVRSFDSHMSQSIKNYFILLIEYETEIVKTNLIIYLNGIKIFLSIMVNSFIYILELV